MENKSIHNETPSERLRRVRSMTGLSRVGFAKKYGVKISTLQSWETGKVHISEKIANKFITLVRKKGILLTLNWLIKGIGDEPCYFSMDKIKEINHVETKKDLSDIKINLLKEFEVFKNNNPNAKIIQVSDDSMLPFYGIHDYVGGKLIASDFHLFHGENCIVYTKKGNVYIRKLIVAENGSYNLICTNSLVNQEPIFNVKIDFLYHIIWCRKQLNYANEVR